MLTELSTDMTVTERELERYTKENVVLREVLRETNQRLEEKIHEFSLFRMVAETINRLVTKDDSLKLLLAKMIEIIGAQNGSIMLISEDSRQLKLVAASGTKDSNPTQPSFPIGCGVAGWVAQESRPAIIGDVRKSDRYYNDGHIGQIRSLLCLPLVFENETIGVMNVSSGEQDAFSQNSERILHIIAGQVAIAIANTQSWKEQKNKEELLKKKNNELMKTKEKLEEAQQQLMNAQKMEAVKQVVVSMHHEINNPLTTIYSCTQLLESHEGTQSGEPLKKIKESCRQISDIVHKLTNLQDLVLTDYVADQKMIDVDKSYSKTPKPKSITIKKQSEPQRDIEQ